MHVSGWPQSMPALLRVGLDEVSWLIVAFNRKDQFKGFEPMESTGKKTDNKGDHFRRLGTVLRDSFDAITVQDLQGRILAWNRGAESMYGYCEAEALAMHIDDLIPARKRDETKRLTADLARGKILPSFESQRIAKDGRTIDIWLTATALMDDEGKVYAIATTERDITSRKENEESLRAANRELEAFVYTISHDLRTPLTPIIGFAEFIRDNYEGHLDTQALDCLAEIITSGEKMLAIMEDLLTLAKVGHVERPAEPCDTEEVVNEAVCGLARQIAKAGVSVDVGDLPTLRVPRTLLTQIFDNLIGNAVRYASSADSPIKIGGERRGNLVRLYVRDHGPGIPKEERSRIFEVFNRGTSGKKSPGTGVGLAIVQKIARLYEGRAWVEETKGGGSTFWVEMVEVPTADENMVDTIQEN